ncbi:unnamed protein product [Absidia cylindrospora]
MSDSSDRLSVIVPLITDYVAQNDLYTCTLISTHFYEIFNPLLWRSVNAQNQPFAHRYLNCLSMTQHSVGHYIRNVNLGDIRWTDQALTNLMHRARLLETLDLFNSRQLTDKSMQYLPYYCSNLTSLKLGKCQVTRLSFRALAQHCRQLTQLELICRTDVSPDTYSAIGRCHSLEELELDMDDGPMEQLLYGRRSRALDTSHMDAWDSPETTLDLTGLHGLKQLTIHRNTYGILDRVVKASETNGACCWPHLISLSLQAELGGVNDDTVVPMMKTLPGLKQLAVTDADLTDATLDAIATFQRDIIKIDVSFNRRFTPYGVRRLVRACPQLKWLNLAYCNIMMNDFLEAGQQCSGIVYRANRSYVALDHLDQESMDAIRLGSHSDDEEGESD